MSKVKKQVTQEKFSTAEAKEKAFYEAKLLLGSKKEEIKVMPDLIEALKYGMELAEFFDFTGSVAKAKANAYARSVTGIDAMKLIGHEEVDDFQEQLYTTTQIGEMVGMSEQQVNKTLEQMGYLENQNGMWVLVGEGKKYGRMEPTDTEPLFN